MTDLITQGLDKWLTQMWVSFYDPFYAYIALGVLIILIATLMAWYFSILRPIAGAIFVGVVFFLVGMRKGQHIEKDRQEARGDNRDIEPSRERWPW